MSSGGNSSSSAASAGGGGGGGGASAELELRTIGEDTYQVQQQNADGSIIGVSSFDGLTYIVLSDGNRQLQSLVEASNTAAPTPEQVAANPAGIAATATEAATGPQGEATGHAIVDIVAPVSAVSRPLTGETLGTAISIALASIGIPIPAGVPTEQAARIIAATRTRAAAPTAAAAPGNLRPSQFGFPFIAHIIGLPLSRRIYFYEQLKMAYKFLYGTEDDAFTNPGLYRYKPSASTRALKQILKEFGSLLGAELPSFHQIANTDAYLGEENFKLVEELGRLTVAYRQSQAPRNSSALVRPPDMSNLFLNMLFVFALLARSDINCTGARLEVIVSFNQFTREQIQSATSHIGASEGVAYASEASEAERVGVSHYLLPSPIKWRSQSKSAAIESFSALKGLNTIEEYNTFYATFTSLCRLEGTEPSIPLLPGHTLAELNTLISQIGGRLRGNPGRRPFSVDVGQAVDSITEGERRALMADERTVSSILVSLGMAAAAAGSGGGGGASASAFPTLGGFGSGGGGASASAFPTLGGFGSGGGGGAPAASSNFTSRAGSRPPRGSLAEERSGGGGASAASSGYNRALRGRFEERGGGGGASAASSGYNRAPRGRFEEGGGASAASSGYNSSALNSRLEERGGGGGASARSARRDAARDERDVVYSQGGNSSGGAGRGPYGGARRTRSKNRKSQKKVRKVKVRKTRVQKKRSTRRR
jgi:hypothetical protein